MNNTDTSPIPEKYEEIIVDRALLFYAEFEEDTTLYQLANTRYQDKYNDLCNEYLPAVEMNRWPSIH